MARCTNPFIKDGMDLPCGKCYDCRARRVSGWSFRLMKEAENVCSAFFVTLTYDTAHVPITDRGFMSLKKSDLTDFFKRLRYYHDEQTKTLTKKGLDITRNLLKYYACGEYGDDRTRPHYHIILFNADLSILVGERMATQIRLGNIKLDGKYHFHESVAWCDEKKAEMGYVSIGLVSGASIGYCLEYITKPKIIPAYKNDDRQKEFSVMSKKLGANYLSEKVAPGRLGKQDVSSSSRWS